LATVIGCGGSAHPSSDDAGDGEVPITASFLIWVLAGLFAAACWGAVVVLNKQVLDYVEPITVNLCVLLVCSATLTAVGIPLSLLHLWSLGLGLTWQAAGWVAINAPITWLVAFSAYYYALRSGHAGVVGTLTATDPLFTGLFAAVLVGAALDGLTITGLVLTVLGVVLMALWMGEEPEPHAPVLEGATMFEATTAPAPGTRTLPVVGFSLVTAAGWGLSPVLVQLAERSTHGATTTMMLLSQTLGIVWLAPFVVARRRALFVSRPDDRTRRHIVRLLVAAGVLNAVFSVLYYVLIAQIGAVLTMVTTATAPIFAIVGGVLVLRERFSRWLALAAAVTLLGVLLASLHHAG
jgi:drug/metabolite transporter (DMT)-like permease